MRGVLGDGSKISEVAPVSAFGTWPLYVALYKNQGFCIAEVTVVATDQSDPCGNSELV